MCVCLIATTHRFGVRSTHDALSLGPQDPRDVVWEHIHIGHIYMAFRKVIVYTLFAAMVLFWMLPGAHPRRAHTHT